VRAKLLLYITFRVALGVAGLTDDNVVTCLPVPL